MTLQFQAVLFGAEAGFNHKVHADLPEAQISQGSATHSAANSPKEAPIGF